MLIEMHTLIYKLAQLISWVQVFKASIFIINKWVSEKANLKVTREFFVKIFKKIFPISLSIGLPNYLSLSCIPVCQYRYDQCLIRSPSWIDQHYQSKSMLNWIIYDQIRIKNQGFMKLWLNNIKSLILINMKTMKSLAHYQIGIGKLKCDHKTDNSV